MLPIRITSLIRRKRLLKEPDFQHPPLWIHESIAGFLASDSRRESKRRALLKLLDRIPIQPIQPLRPQPVPLVAQPEAKNGAENRGQSPIS